MVFESNVCFDLNRTSKVFSSFSSRDEQLLVCIILGENAWPKVTKLIKDLIFWWWCWGTLPGNEFQFHVTQVNYLSFFSCLAEMILELKFA